MVEEGRVLIKASSVRFTSWMRHKLSMFDVERSYGDAVDRKEMTLQVRLTEKAFLEIASVAEHRRRNRMPRRGKGAAGI